MLGRRSTGDIYIYIYVYGKTSTKLTDPMNKYLFFAQNDYTREKGLDCESAISKCKRYKFRSNVETH